MDGRRQPVRGDVIDTILEGVIYEDGTEAPWEHKVSILVDLTFGGIATTTFVMSSAIHYLAIHPDLRQQLIDDPSLIENAIEEFCRVFPPVIALGRTCTRDVEVAGTEMREGDFVMLTWGAASRDPRAMEEPEKNRHQARNNPPFDIRRGAGIAASVRTSRGSS